MSDTIHPTSSALVIDAASATSENTVAPLLTSSKVAELSLSLRLFAVSMRQFNRLAPNTTARLLLHHFLIPRRPASADYTRQLPAAAQPLRLCHRDALLRGWCWQAHGSSQLHGPTVLLVHGWEDHSGAMLPLVKPLLHRGYRVLTLDAPGHGLSPKSPTHLHDYGLALQQLLQQEHGVYAVIAHSWGAAAISAMLARRPDLQPTRMALVAPMQGLQQHLNIFAGIAGMCEQRLARMAALLQQRIDIPMQQLCAVHAASRLQAPGLVIHDSRDPLIPHSTANAIAAGWANAQLMTTRDLGHRRILANPAVHERIVQFLEE